jgi:hypothetical protein
MNFFYFWGEAIRAGSYGIYFFFLEFESTTFLFFFSEWIILLIDFGFNGAC